MALEEEPFEGVEGGHEEFVPAVFARSAEEAEAYCELLNDHEIPAIIGDEANYDEEADEAVPTVKGMTHGVPVLVPEPWLDEAGQLIAVQDELDDFTVDDDEDDDEDEDEHDEFGLHELDEEALDDDEEDDDLFDDDDEEHLLDEEDL